jgi:hypothetical protein
MPISEQLNPLYSLKKAGEFVNDLSQGMPQVPIQEDLTLSPQTSPSPFAKTLEDNVYPREKVGALLSKIEERKRGLPDPETGEVKPVLQDNEIWSIIKSQTDPELKEFIDKTIINHKGEVGAIRTINEYLPKEARIDPLKAFGKDIEIQPYEKESWFKDFFREDVKHLGFIPKTIKFLDRNVVSPLEEYGRKQYIINQRYLDRTDPEYKITGHNRPITNPEEWNKIERNNARMVANWEGIQKWTIGEGINEQIYTPEEREQIAQDVKDHPVASFIGDAQGFVLGLMGVAKTFAYKGVVNAGELLLKDRNWMKFVAKNVGKVITTPSVKRGMILTAKGTGEMITLTGINKLVDGIYTRELNAKETLGAMEDAGLMGAISIPAGYALGKGVMKGIENVLKKIIIKQESGVLSKMVSSHEPLLPIEGEPTVPTTSIPSEKFTKESLDAWKKLSAKGIKRLTPEENDIVQNSTIGMPTRIQEYYKRLYRRQPLTKNQVRDLAAWERRYTISEDVIPKEEVIKMLKEEPAIKLLINKEAKLKGLNVKEEELKIEQKAKTKTDVSQQKVEPKDIVENNEGVVEIKKNINPPEKEIEPNPGYSDESEFGSPVNTEELHTKIKAVDEQPTMVDTRNVKFSEGTDEGIKNMYKGSPGFVRNPFEMLKDIRNKLNNEDMQRVGEAVVKDVGKRVNPADYTNYSTLSLAERAIKLKDSLVKINNSFRFLPGLIAKKEAPVYVKEMFASIRDDANRSLNGAVANIRHEVNDLVNYMFKENGIDCLEKDTQDARNICRLQNAIQESRDVKRTIDGKEFVEKGTPIVDDECNIIPTEDVVKELDDLLASSSDAAKRIVWRKNKVLGEENRIRAENGIWNPDDAKMNYWEINYERFGSSNGSSVFPEHIGDFTRSYQKQRTTNPINNTTDWKDFVNMIREMKVQNTVAKFTNRSCQKLDVNNVLLMKDFTLDKHNELERLLMKDINKTLTGKEQLRLKELTEQYNNILKLKIDENGSAIEDIRYQDNKLIDPKIQQEFINKGYFKLVKNPDGTETHIFNGIPDKQGVRIEIDGNYYDTYKVQTYSKTKCYTIPIELKAAFNEFDKKLNNEVLDAINTATKMFKWNAIVSTFERFTINNLGGDEVLVAMKIPQAYKKGGEMWGFLYKLSKKDGEKLLNEKELAYWEFIRKSGTYRVGGVGEQGILETKEPFYRFVAGLQKVNEIRERPVRTMVAMYLKDCVDLGVDIGKKFPWIDTYGLSQLEAAWKVARELPDYAMTSDVYNKIIRGWNFPFATWYIKEGMATSKWLFKTKGKALVPVIGTALSMRLWNNKDKEFRDMESRAPDWYTSSPHINIGKIDDNTLRGWTMPLPPDVFFGWGLLGVFGANYEDYLRHKDDKDLNVRVTYKEFINKTVKQWGLVETGKIAWMANVMYPIAGGLIANKDLRTHKAIWDINDTPEQINRDKWNWVIIKMHPPLTQITYSSNPATSFKSEQLKSFGFYDIPLGQNDDYRNFETDNWKRKAHTAVSHIQETYLRTSWEADFGRKYLPNFPQGRPQSDSARMVNALQVQEAYLKPYLLRESKYNKTKLTVYEEFFIKEVRGALESNKITSWETRLTIDYQNLSNADKIGKKGRDILQNLKDKRNWDKTMNDIAKQLPPPPQTAP